MPDGFTDAWPVTIAQAVSVGTVARAVLTRGGDGRVAASFRRSLYVSLPGGWVCLGDSSIGAGALNLACRRGDLPTNVLAGATASVADGRLRLAGEPEVAWASAPVWRPRAPPAAGLLSPRRGLAALSRLLADMPRAHEGLACYALAAAVPTTPVQRRAATPVAALRAWLADLRRDSGAREPDGSVAALLGLGPGLTPSGDDCLVGALVALHKLRRTQALAALWALIRPRLAGATHALSAAHLHAAAEGAAGAALDEVVDAIVRGDAVRLAGALPALATQGHSSGLDALAGAAAAIRALHGAASSSSPARLAAGA